MGKLLQTALRWTLRRLVWFMLIAAILAAGNALRQEFAQFELLIEELAILRSGDQELDRQRRTIAAAAAERVQALENASQERLTARVAALERELEQERASLHGQGVVGLLATPIGAGLVERLKQDLAIAVLEQERDHLQRLIRYADALRDSRAAQARLEALRLAHVAAYAALAQAERELAAADGSSLWRGRWLFWSPEFAARQRLEQARAAQAAGNQAAFERYEAQRRLVAGLALPGLPRFEIPPQRLDAVLQPLRQALRQREERYRANWVSQAAGPVIAVLPAAALILLFVVLVPVALKAALYFLVAPLAARLPTVRLIPQAAAMPVRQDADTKISAVSLPLVIGRGQQLLIHPEYLQSSSVQGKQATQWLLDWSYPLSSLAAGLFALTRIRCDSAASFVISATRDPLSEVGIVALPDGAALVLQPRALVGVVMQDGRPLRISRHWRLGSLHAWLTLQLRYLVFHGPAELIVTGCRGIRLEAAGSGRSINQAATLGFSANIDYATRRCATFGAYLMGQDELFNDCFSGDGGCYVYEEMPDRGRRPGITGRGIEGIADSLLRVFGI
ncbi:MAG: hypothetical protein HZC24_06790 [Rhodocyclales bacterium]|nr:hypothetical protein [Rhodocyclales bacterium]